MTYLVILPVVNRMNKTHETKMRNYKKEDLRLTYDMQLTDMMMVEMPMVSMEMRILSLLNLMMEVILKMIHAVMDDFMVKLKGIKVRMIVRTQMGAHHEYGLFRAASELLELHEARGELFWV